MRTSLLAPVYVIQELELLRISGGRTTFKFQDDGFPPCLLFRGDLTTVSLSRWGESSTFGLGLSIGQPQLSSIIYTILVDTGNLQFRHASFEHRWQERRPSFHVSRNGIVLKLLDDSEFFSPFEELEGLPRLRDHDYFQFNDI